MNDNINTSTKIRVSVQDKAEIRRLLKEYYGSKDSKFNALILSVLVVCCAYYDRGEGKNLRFASFYRDVHSDKITDILYIDALRNAQLKRIKGLTKQ